MTPPTGSLNGLHHVALTVTDLDRSVPWYERVLGMSVRFRDDAPTRRAAILEWPGCDETVGLVEHSASARGAFSPTVTGLDHVGFTVRTRDGMREWERHLDAEGIAHSGAIDAPPGTILNFKDPDGIALALFWDRQ